MTGNQRLGSEEKDIFQIAFVLARYLSIMLDRYECQKAPSGLNGAARITPERFNPAPRAESDDAGPEELKSPPPLIPDQEYTIKEAELLTHWAIPTLRKMLNSGKLASRKVEGRRMILGSELAKIITRSAHEEAGSSV
jgi:hypothetical protein